MSLSTFFCTQLNGFTHFYLIQIINWLLFICLNTIKWFQILWFNTNNSIKHESFVFTHLDDQTVLFQTNNLTCHFFALSLNVKQFYLTCRKEPIKCYHSGPEWIWGWWQVKGHSAFPKAPTLAKLHHQNIVIYQTLIGGGGGSYSFAEMQLMNSTAPAGWTICELVYIYIYIYI